MPWHARLCGACKAISETLHSTRSLTARKGSIRPRCSAGILPASRLPPGRRRYGSAEILPAPMPPGRRRYNRHAEEVQHQAVRDLVLGLGLLTKAYFLMSLPALALIFLLVFWQFRDRPLTVGLHVILVAILAASISGWWYWNARTITGSWSGQLDVVALRDVPLLDLAKRVPEVRWARALDFILVTHTWFGNWSFLQVRSWMYHFFFLIGLLALVGLLLFTVRLSCNTARPGWPMLDGRHLFVLISFYAFFWVGLGYHVLVNYVHAGSSASLGWYLYCLVIPEVVLCSVGLLAIAPSGLRQWVIPAGASCLVLLEVYSTHFVLIPYYTGLIAHTPDGRLPAFRLEQAWPLGLDGVFDRLAANKPDALGGWGLMVGWFAFLAATLGLLALGFLLSSWVRPAGRRSHPG